MAPATDWLTADAYKAWARITDGRDDEAIGSAVAAAVWAINGRCGNLWAEGDSVPPDVAQAGLLWANRLLARRNSPEGVIGVSDLGIANIKALDRDIVEMIGPYLAVPVA